jgi:hypothetical protein
MRPMLDKTSSPFLKATVRVLYHVVLVALSAGIAFSLPMTVNFVSRRFLAYWATVENQKIVLISAEIVLAVMLILLFNYIDRNWRDRKFAKMARGSGMVHFFPTTNFFTLRKIKKLKKRQGLAREVMIVSSTGFRTFVDPKGDLHEVVRTCRDAKIMLLNPFSEGARMRARSILDPNITPESFDEQIRKSIDFLKDLKAGRKNIKLKLYQDSPFLKLAILGDYVWIKHYHPGLDIQALPEFVFDHDQNPGSLYNPFYQHFLTCWENPGNPEYDFDTDDLVYRDGSGNEIKREKFDRGQATEGHSAQVDDFARFANADLF